MKIIRLQGDAEIRSGIYYEYDVDATPLGEGGMGRVFKGFRVCFRVCVRNKPAYITTNPLRMPFAKGKKSVKKKDLFHVTEKIYHLGLVLSTVIS